MADFETPTWCLPVFIGLTVMNECILLPIMIYYTYAFWKLRHDIFFAKRRPLLILTSIICMGICPVIRPLQLYEYWYGTEPFFIKLMNFWPYALAFTVAFLRFWLTLYDFKYNEAFYFSRLQKELLKNNKSVRIGSLPSAKSLPEIQELSEIEEESDKEAHNATDIDTKIVNTIDICIRKNNKNAIDLNVTNSNSSGIGQISNNTDVNSSDLNMDSHNSMDFGQNIRTETAEIVHKSENKWIKHKQTCGTLRGSLTISSTVFILYLIIVITLRIVSRMYAVAFQFLYLGVIVGFTVWSKRQISAHRDEFYIGEEFDVISKPGIAFVLTWGVSIAIDPFFPPLSTIIATIISFIATSVGLSMYTIIGLRWAINKYFGSWKVQSMLEATSHTTLDLPLNACLAHNDGYYLFFEYLVGEFSVENLEFITDAIYVKNKFDMTKRASIHMKHSKYVSGTFEWPELPLNIHKSEIMKVDKLYDAIVSIFRIYVNEGSVREINLSFKLRAEMKSRMEFIALNERTLNVDMFDKCIEEVLYLLKDAYLRFKATKKYQIFADAMSEKKITHTHNVSQY